MDTVGYAELWCLRRPPLVAVNGAVGREPSNSLQPWADTEPHEGNHGGRTLRVHARAQLPRPRTRAYPAVAAQITHPTTRNRHELFQRELYLSPPSTILNFGDPALAMYVHSACCFALNSVSWVSLVAGYPLNGLERPLGRLTPATGASSE